MNSANIFSAPNNTQTMDKKIPQNNSFLIPNLQDNKIIQSIPEHSSNFPFKVVLKEKETHIPNTFLFLNSEKGAKNNGKNINIIKPKFVTKTMPTDQPKIKNIEEAPSLNLSLNLSSSAFQPQIVKDNKEFATKCNNKIYNLILDNTEDIFKLELHQLNDDVYLLKYFYENNFTLDDLKALNKFFCLFDNIPDMMKELEKWLGKNQYTVLEDLENKLAKITISVPILQNYQNIEMTLIQKNYSKDNLFKILCQKVANISRESELRISKLEKENKFLLINLFHLTNSLNPMNMNYQLHQRENIRNMNNINLNRNNNNMNNIERGYRSGNSNNNMNNINKNVVLIKSAHNNQNMNNKIEMKDKLLNLKEEKFDENKENKINLEEQNDEDNGSNSLSDNFFKERKDKNIILNKKRVRNRKLSNSSNKNNSNLKSNNNSNGSNLSTENIINANKNVFEMNYYVLKDIKSRKVKVKGLYEIFKSPDELFMIVNKILYKYYKYKRTGSILNYENKLNFCLLNLFDSNIHGDSAFAFHNRCDYKFNTISVIETDSGHRFGGYTSECFESPNEYFDKKDNLSFVFSLDKNKIYDVIKDKDAISCDIKYGPYFRDDQICIVDEFFTNESGTCIKGKGFLTTKNYELNLGKKYFKVKRLQVFQIKIKRIK